MISAANYLSVLGLLLKNMGLIGTTDIDIFAEISSIQILSFANNDFGGSFLDVKKLIC